MGRLFACLLILGGIGLGCGNEPPLHAVPGPSGGAGGDPIDGHGGSAGSPSGQGGAGGGPIDGPGGAGAGGTPTGGSGGQTPVDPPEPPVPTENPIPAENLLPGDPDWDDTYDAWNRQIEGYADRVSARAGDTVRFMIRSDQPKTATWRLYRIGWYGGAGARRVAEGGPIQVGPQPDCPPARGTGLIRCGWTESFRLSIDPDWLSGIYVLRLQRQDGYTRFVPLVVTDERPADLLLQTASTTYQAYNRWGGNSLYVDDSGLLPLGRATHVSFDRPYASDQGAGQLFRYEIHMARFLERHGYDVTYATNLDLHQHGASLMGGRRAFVTVGHDEYWSGEMRDAAEAIRDRGKALLFFGANQAYWKVRLEAPLGQGNPRVMVCYKGRSRDDPVQGPGVTARFRDPEVDRPENGLVGVMYESWQILSSPFVAGSGFLYENTGLLPGDTLPGLVGYEYDRVVDNGATPPGFTVLSRSPVIDAEGKPGWSESGFYRGPRGSFVFAAGTIEWSFGLGHPTLADPRVERMTANVLREALGIPVPEGVGSGPLPIRPTPMGPFSEVGTVARGLTMPSGVAELPDGSLVVAEPRRHQILRINREGRVEVLAGDGNLSRNPAFDGVPGLRARFYHPTAVLTDEQGDVIVADTYNHVIRKILNDEQRTVITVAGAMGQAGYVDGEGSRARFFMPTGLAFDPASGDILVADMYNHRIRSIELGSWRVRTVAGSGPGDMDGPAFAARFSYPTAVTADDGGRIYAVATGNAKVIRVDVDTARTVTTLAGGSVGFVDGSGNAAALAPQGGIVWDGASLLVSEPTNLRIRRIFPGEDASQTRVRTAAGSGRHGVADGPGDRADFTLPLGLARRRDGTVLICDAASGSIRSLR